VESYLETEQISTIILYNNNTPDYITVKTSSIEITMEVKSSEELALLFDGTSLGRICSDPRFYKIYMPIGIDITQVDPAADNFVEVFAATKPRNMISAIDQASNLPKEYKTSPNPTSNILSTLNRAADAKNQQVLINETALKGTDVVKKLTELRRAARALHSTSIIALAHKINTADTKNIPMVGVLFDANVLNTTSKTWNAEADVTKKEIISHNND